MNKEVKPVSNAPVNPPVNASTQVSAHQPADAQTEASASASTDASVNTLNTLAETPIIALTVNGTERQIAEGTTLAGLLKLLDLDPRMIVVEHNRTILRDHATYPSTILKDGDVLELVHFVGGG